MQAKDYYRILGVSDTVTADEMEVATQVFATVGEVEILDDPIF